MPQKEPDRAHSEKRMFFLPRPGGKRALQSSSSKGEFPGQFAGLTKKARRNLFLRAFEENMPIAESNRFNL